MNLKTTSIVLAAILLISAMFALVGFLGPDDATDNTPVESVYGTDIETLPDFSEESDDSNEENETGNDQIAGAASTGSGPSGGVFAVGGSGGGGGGGFAPVGDPKDDGDEGSDDGDEGSENPEEIPEFSTIAIPSAMVLGMVFFMSRRKRSE